MNRGSLWLLSLSLTAAGCTCGAFDPNTTRFACSTDDECGAGYVCAPANGGQECVLATATGGGGGGAVTGGGSGGGAMGGGGGALGGGGGEVDGGVDAGELDAGPGTDAGVDGGADGGPGDAGTDAGVPVPDHLVITTPAQTLPTSTCSNALTVEMRDTSNRPVTSPGITQLSLTSSLPQVSFFSGTGCLAPSIGLITIPAGSTSTTLSFRGLQPGTAVLTIASLTARPGMVTQAQTLTAPPAALAFVSPAPVAPVAGLCFLATVEARSAASGPATNVVTDTTINLQSVPANALRFFSDAACTTSTSTTLMPGGQSRASFYVKTISGGADTIVAVAPFGTANQQLQVTGVVRRGTCSIGSLQPSWNCPISPPQTSLAKTMVVYQATASSSSPDDYEVRCRLTTVDTLTCERNGTGSRVDIAWQTAELPTGLAVQRGFGTNCGAGFIALPPSVNPATNFVLSSFSGIGTNFDGDDLSSARLLNDAGVALVLDNRSGQGCAGYEYQVVELSGVTTIRGGTGPLGLGLRQVGVSGLPPASANAVLLNQALLAGTIPNTTSMCNLLVRGELASPTSLLFSRGADQINALACNDMAITDIPWERVDFGTRARVQSFPLQLQNNSFDLTPPTFSAVDPTRTLVFAGGQMAGGQSSGETSVDNQGDDSIGQSQARFELSSGTLVKVTRGRSQATGIVTVYMVELEP